jgi:hypothetical protein
MRSGLWSAKTPSGRDFFGFWANDSGEWPAADGVAALIAYALEA